MSWVEAFKVLTAKTHSEQAKWWLNGFWTEGAEKNAEDIWKFAHQFIEISSGQKVAYGKRTVEVQETSDLDEFQAHRFLELNGETLTVQELRKKLKHLDLDNNHRLALLEYLIHRYGIGPEKVVKAPQGTIPPEVMAAAEKKMQDASNALNTALADAEIAASTLAAAKTAKVEADRAFEENKAAQAAAEAAYTANVAAQEAATAAFNENKAAQERAEAAYQKVKEAEAPLKAAEEEVKAAVDDLKAQEAAYAGKIKACEDKIADTTLSTVQIGKAKNELEQLKSEDPLPLRKAKITQEAALKRVQKQRAAAEVATKAAEAKAAEATAAAEAAAAAERELEEQTRQLEAAENELRVKFEEAQAALEAIKRKGGGVAQGAIFWMEKDLAEARKFMKGK